MNELISELVAYGIENDLIDDTDKVYVVNKLLELFELNSFEWKCKTVRPLQLILDEMVDYAVEKGILKQDTITNRDLFDTKIMGMITPPPSFVRKRFKELYAESPKKATDFYYKFSKDTNYIRTDRIAKDEKWQTETPYGVIDITINLSKPEKDPKDIANAANQVKSNYPNCLLCQENEGYAGTLSHPASKILNTDFSNFNYIGSFLGGLFLSLCLLSQFS